MTAARARYGLHGIAFVRQVGGRIHVLLAIDEDDRDCFAGEPVLLVDHRPGAPAAELVVEGADALAGIAVELVRGQASQLAAWIDAAVDRTGAFDGERLVGEAHRFDGPPGAFRPIANE